MLICSFCFLVNTATARSQGAKVSKFHPSPNRSKPSTNAHKNYRPTKRKNAAHIELKYPQNKIPKSQLR